MSEIDPLSLKPGDRLRYKNTHQIVTIKERKQDDTGWWLRSNQGGLMDDAIAKGDGWTPIEDGAEYTDPDEELAMANARLKEAEALLRRWCGSFASHQIPLKEETEAWLMTPEVPTYAVRLTCGHSHRYRVLGHLFPGTMLHCPTCDETQYAVEASDRRG